MSGEDIQTGDPGGVSNQPPPPPLPSRLEVDGNHLRHSDPTENRLALTAFWLGTFSLFPLGGCLTLPAWGHGLSGYEAPVVALVCVCLESLSGLGALTYGIKGIRYRNRHPTVGGQGYAIVGIISGILTSSIGLFFAYFLMMLFGGGGWK